MGAIANGRFKELGGYGTGKGQIDLAKQNRIATAGQVLPEVYLAHQGANMAFSIFGALTQSGRSADGAKSSKELDTPEKVEAARTEVLSGYGFDNVGDFEVEILSAKANIEELTKNNEAKQATIEQKELDLTGYEYIIADLKSQLANLDKNDPNYETSKQVIKDSIEKIKQEIKLLEKEVKELEKEIKENEKIIEAQNKRIENLEADKKEVQDLDNKLKELDKDNPVKQWDNVETQDIISLIKEYKQLVADGKTDEANNLKAGKLNDAIGAYSQNHAASKNPTLERLINSLEEYKCYGDKK